MSGGSEATAAQFRFGENDLQVYHIPQIINYSYERIELND